jgi:chorismate mutase
VCNFGSFRLPLSACGLLLLLIAACAAPPLDGVEKVDRLLLLMQQRLQTAEDVARIKWNSGAPIEDVARENAIVEQAGAEATRYGVRWETAREFLRAQIEASKVIQRARFAEWSKPTEGAPCKAYRSIATADPRS